MRRSQGRWGDVSHKRKNELEIASRDCTTRAPSGRNSDQALKRTPLAFTNCGHFSAASKSDSPKLTKTCVWHDVRSYRTHGQIASFRVCLSIEPTRVGHAKVSEAKVDLRITRFSTWWHVLSIVVSVCLCLLPTSSDLCFHPIYLNVSCTRSSMYVWTHQPRSHSEGPPQAYVICYVTPRLALRRCLPSFPNRC